MMIRNVLVYGVVLLISATGLCGEWVSEDGVEGWRFETPSLTGLLVARDTRELGKGYGKHGLRDVVFKPTGDYLNSPEGTVGAKRRHQGLLNLYRVYGDGETFGALRDDQAEAEPTLADDGKT